VLRPDSMYDGYKKKTKAADSLFSVAGKDSTTNPPSNNMMYINKMPDCLAGIRDKIKE